MTLSVSSANNPLLIILPVSSSKRFVRVPTVPMILFTTPCILGKAELRAAFRRRSEEPFGDLGGNNIDVLDLADEGEVINSSGRISENVLGGGLVDTSTDKFRVASNELIY